MNAVITAEEGRKGCRSSQQTIHRIIAVITAGFDLPVQLAVGQLGPKGAKRAKARHVSGPALRYKQNGRLARFARSSLPRTQIKRRKS